MVAKLGRVKFLKSSSIRFKNIPCRRRKTKCVLTAVVAWHAFDLPLRAAGVGLF